MGKIYRLLLCETVQQYTYGKLSDPIYIWAIKPVRMRDAVSQVNNQIAGIVGNILRDNRSCVNHHIPVLRSLQQAFCFGMCYCNRRVVKVQILRQFFNGVPSAYDGMDKISDLIDSLCDMSKIVNGTSNTAR